MREYEIPGGAALQARQRLRRDRDEEMMRRRRAAPVRGLNASSTLPFTLHFARVAGQEAFGR
jgi:hypothetical protein